MGGPGDGTKVILKTLNLNRVFELSQRQANFDGINDDELLQVSERSGGGVVTTKECVTLTHPILLARRS